MISELNYGKLSKIKWNRAARTDKGVHAIHNCISCKLLINNDYIDSDKNIENLDRLTKTEFKQNFNSISLINKLNNEIENIRFIAFKKVSKNFSCRSKATSRTYKYICPKFIFKDYSIDLANIQNLCNKFIGSKSFHNYTIKTKFKQPTAYRIIKRFEVDYFKKDFLIFTIEGQSFLYRQIRKMVGIIIQIAQKKLEEIDLERSFENNKINIWLAPKEGLYLSNINYQNYEERNDIPEKLDLNEEELSIKNEYETNIIQQFIVSNENIFFQWLSLVLSYEFQEPDTNDD